MNDDETPDGTIKVYFTDNTYKTLQLKYETTVSAVIEWLCKRLAAASVNLDPERQGLFIIAPGNNALRERRLEMEDRPLEIQAKGSFVAFKFLFKECGRKRAIGEEADSGVGDKTVDDASNGCSAAYGHAVGSLRIGPMEKLSKDEQHWKGRHFVLDFDRLWFSKAPPNAARSSEAPVPLKCIPLCECEHVDKGAEGSDKRILSIVTKNRTYKLRARNDGDRDGWLLAVAKQTALVKEKDILEQADGVIANVEFQHATKQLDLLESFGTLSGVLRHRESRQLFLDFVHQLSDCNTELEDGVDMDEVRWRPELPPEALITGLEDLARAGSLDESTPSIAFAFAQSELLPRFKARDDIQNRLCVLAALD